MTQTPETPDTSHQGAHSNSSRTGSFVVTALVTCALVTACSSPESVDQDVSAVGENGSVGNIDLLSIVLVASAEGEPGRLLGTLENESTQSVEVIISDEDDSAVITVPAGDEYRFSDNEILFDTVADAPGATTTITAATAAGSTELLVPIHDGTLERFRPYLPN